MAGKFQHDSNALRALRTARRKRGLCAETKCQARSGKRYRCAECAAVYAQRVRKFRARKAQEARIAGR